MVEASVEESLSHRHLTYLPGPLQERSAREESGRGLA